MSNSEIYKTFQQDFPSRHFIRFGDNRHICLYIGRDDDARYSFDFRGKFKPVKISSSDVIAVEQYKERELLTLRFSLENNDEFMEKVRYYLSHTDEYLSMKERIQSYQSTSWDDCAKEMYEVIQGLE